MPELRQLGDLQLAILRVLWEQREASAADVHEALHPERGLAPTTIATMLAKLEKKGLIAHRSEGRQFIYRAKVGEDEVQRSLVADLVDRVFLGDPSALVNHLIDAGEIDVRELEKLKQRIAAERGARREATS